MKFMTDKTIKRCKTAFSVTVMGLLILLCAKDVSAEVIHSNQYLKDNGITQEIDKGDDYENIVASLKQDGEVTLAEGETYKVKKTIMLKDGWSIDATGATIYCNRSVFSHGLTKTNYGSLKNVKIKGGTWLSDFKNGYTKSYIHFTHASNIELSDMTINSTNYEGHSIELVACKNVTIKNCKITPKGKPNKKSVEEPLQIDLATGTTYPAIKGTKFANGAACKNIKIIGCTIKGNRGICANYSPRESKYLNKFHENITIKNCKITGVSSEAVALFNTAGATVTGNTIISNASLSRDSYSVGCHFHLFGKNSVAKKRKITVSNNVIKGGRQALYFYSHTSQKYGMVVIKNNKLYCKNGAGNALKTVSVSKLTSSGNKTNGWK